VTLKDLIVLNIKVVFQTIATKQPERIHVNESWWFAETWCRRVQKCFTSCKQAVRGLPIGTKTVEHMWEVSC